MDFLGKVFNWMVIIGLILLLGRIVTEVFLFMDIPFPPFFKDYSVISIIVLIIGAIGQHYTKPDKK
ncbi:hypothetical protein SRABI96_04211 [Peribacillus sp. Bi96]|uniref:hypothetical protein n=1 Tax=unclassified Peribacillus TaxID=2675266 RepID=UPI001D83CA78|nr:hypothetical protein [Peribacillus sp. Bi96]CAH0289186.1 hypothetical protein SRABI96_04211 [Peribacillus sp. Bi96]